MTQIDRLIRAIRERNNPSVMGLDTRVDYLPEAFAKRHVAESGPAGAILAYNKALMEGLRDIVPAVKIQSAYYELLGSEGIRCMEQTIEAARALDYVVMVDAKRGDIGATASAYSAAYLAPDAPLPADFLTVNAFLGLDGVEPFMADCRRGGKGIFILVKTSNPSSGDFQDLRVSDGRALFEHIGEKVSAWGADMIGSEGYSAVGAVVGATYPEQGALLRARMPHTFFLVPGYGAQGATASDLAGCFDRNHGGAIVNASRSLLCAHKKSGAEDFVAAAREEAARMRDDLAAIKK